MISMQVSQEVTQTVYNREVQNPEEVTVTADGIETLSDKDMTITYLKEVTTGSSAGTYTEVDECKMPVTIRSELPEKETTVEVLI